MLRRAARAARLDRARDARSAWGPRHEVNEFVGRSRAELAARGPPGARSPRRRSRGRRSASRARDPRPRRERPERAVRRRLARRARAGGDGPPVLAVGGAAAAPRARGRGRRRCRSTSAAALEALLGGVDFDIVHVHDPFAPSAAVGGAAPLALAQRRQLPRAAERVLSTQVARPLVEIFFGRLDARTVELRRPRDLMERYFPGRYELRRARRAPRRGPVARPRAGGDDRAGSDRVLRGGGARRAAPLPARAAPAARRARLGGGDLARRTAATSRISQRAARAGPASSGRGDATAEALIGGRRRGLRRLRRPARGARADPRGARLGHGADRLAPAALRGADRRRRARAAVPARRRDHARGPARAADRRARACAASCAARRAGASRDWARGRRPARGDLPRGSRRAATTPRATRRCAAHRAPQADPHRPAHAHRPLARLRDPGRHAARDGAGAGLGAIAITDHNEVSGALEAREIADEIGGSR